jgi:hypothetical protein
VEKSTAAQLIAYLLLLSCIIQCTYLVAIQSLKYISNKQASPSITYYIICLLVAMQQVVSNNCKQATGAVGVCIGDGVMFSYVCM